eukprot:TRINITY_DN17629_c0_g1_i1.p1 TRINITY_DN17629_c0_g1~~TRINITY_DN17629_c0_g1_i1.p1  ORF type:complete len:203 (+),score=30.77 TRINITY_DN17629_c0_g1_i1:99-707(+)
MIISRPQPLPRERRLIFLGDHSVGKTSFLIRIQSGFSPFLEENYYIPNYFENQTIETTYKECIYHLSLWDTGGRHVPDKFTRLSYPDVDICFLCFSVVGKQSFTNLKIAWASELKLLPSKTIVVLVGMKSDLRENKKFQESIWPGIVNKEEAQVLVNELGLKGYIECSALTGHNVQEVLHEGLRLFDGQNPKKKKKSNCTLS